MNPSKVVFKIRDEITNLEDDLEAAKRIVKRLEYTLYCRTIVCYLVFQPKSEGSPELIPVSNRIEATSKLQPTLSFLAEGSDKNMILVVYKTTGTQKERLAHLPSNLGSISICSTEAEAEREIAVKQEKVVQKINAILDKAQQDGEE